MIDIANIKSVWPGNYDEVWAVVRSLKSNPKQLWQVQELSPSTSLFYDYLSWKKAVQNRAARAFVFAIQVPPWLTPWRGVLLVQN